MNEFDNFDEESMRTMRGDTADGLLGRIDQYDIIRKLGGGGFGVVYLVRDTISNVEYAIKTLHPLLKGNPEEMENLRNQFSLVSKLSHTNIASAMYLHPIREVVYATEEVRKELRLSAGDFVMVMKYAPGVTLSKWRKQFQNEIVPVDKAIDICKQIASALDYAHSEKIIHRDIKPGNIMVETCENGSIIARVLDFGLAAEIRSSMSRVSTDEGDSSGTRPYMAPEQWQGKKQDPATDQYALACLFYELVSGAVPFAGVFETGDFNAMMYAIENREPESLREIKPSQNNVLMRALSKDAKKRWSSCFEFVNKLESNQIAAKPKLLLWIFVLLVIGFAFLYLKKINDEINRLSFETVLTANSKTNSIEDVSQEIGDALEEQTESLEQPVEEKTDHMQSSNDIEIKESSEDSNNILRNKISEIQKSILTLKTDTIIDDAKVLEVDQYEKALNQEQEAIKALEKGDLVFAESKFKDSFETYNLAITSAKKKIKKSEEKLLQAQAFEKYKQWPECLDFCKESLEWNPNNEAAKALEEKANEQLKPMMIIIGKKDGEKVPGQNLVELDGRKYDFGERIEVAEGKNYEDIIVNCIIGGKNFSGKVAIGRVGWKGDKTFIIDLIENSKEITVAGIEMVRIPDSAKHKGLYFGKYEVTQEKWKEIMGNNPSYFKGDLSRPVEQVSWNDCQEFIKKLNARTEVKSAGITFRLPTEQEWEYACRAGSKGRYGLLADGQEGTLDEMGWYVGNLGVNIPQNPYQDDESWAVDLLPLLKTHTVGQKKPNAWGLYDMHGNVCEWAVSANGELPYYCGGSYYDRALDCEADDRFLNYLDGRIMNRGLRLVAFRTNN